MTTDDWFVIRDPIHGFIKLSSLEKKIIRHSAFQRLRRIRQLAWTDMVYPGSTHTRFEHSLGVMHLATRIFDTIWEKNPEILREYGIPIDAKNRVKQIIRLAALLHDIGHGPFSHSSEKLFPSIKGEKNKRYKHEDYSISIIETLFADLISEDQYIQNHGINLKEITQMIGGKVENTSLIFWNDIISSQLDADRMDYLLRDSYYTGTRYGFFDLERVIETITIAPRFDSDSLTICTEKGGLQSAIELILARYSMFNQVYFHKVRRGYDVVLESKLINILPDGVFPEPTNEGIKNFIKWDDWIVYSHICQNNDCYKRIFMEREKPVCLCETDNITEFEEEREKYSDFNDIFCDRAEKSPYNIGRNEINIWDKSKKKTLLRLCLKSHI